MMVKLIHLEGWKTNGMPYPPDHIICDILQFIRQNGKLEMDFLRDKDFAKFRIILDRR